MTRDEETGLRTYGVSIGVSTEELGEILDDLRNEWGSLDSLVQAIGEYAATHAEELREDAEEVDERAPGEAGKVAMLEEAAEMWQGAANELFRAAKAIVV